jgi:hypothetical protein
MRAEEHRVYLRKEITQHLWQRKTAANITIEQENMGLPLKI